MSAWPPVHQSDSTVPGRGGWLTLAGMPGSGKSTVGRILAGLYNMRFVDLDEHIEALAGMSIPEIFAAEGEVGFRTREHQALSDLMDHEPAVLATGGGTLLHYGDRRELELLGTVVCLTASVATLAARIAAAKDHRPLLDEAAPDESEFDENDRVRALRIRHGLGDPEVRAEETRKRRQSARRKRIEARVRSLMKKRQSFYDSLPWQVDTENRTPEEVAGTVQRLVAVLGPLAPDASSATEAIPVRRPPEALDRRGERAGYSVVVGAGLLDALGALLEARGIDGKAVIVSDMNVARLYAHRVQASLERVGIVASLLVMEPGERAKSLDTVSMLYEGLVNAGLDRDGTVIALGGGVVGDTAGFAAASYLRGVSFVQVPTSLLAMVDASIGGKTGVNLPQGKNLVGAFKHPALVLADTETLATLPDRELRGGLAEAVKAALIARFGLYLRLRNGAPEASAARAWVGIVADAVKVKAEIVSEDPGERGRRILLNLGHTFAHAFEHVSEYALPHGEAVAVGLAGAVRLAAALDELEDPHYVREVESLLQALGLPIRYPGPDPQALLDAMSTDKKRRDGGLRFVLPLSREKVVVRENLSEATVLEVLRVLVEPYVDS